MSLATVTVGQIVMYFPENGSKLKCNGATSIPGIVQQKLSDSINLVVFPLCSCHPAVNLKEIPYKIDVTVGGIIPSNQPYWFETT